MSVIRQRTAGLEQLLVPQAALKGKMISLEQSHVRLEQKKDVTLESVVLDQFFPTVDNSEVPIRIDYGDIARLQPAVRSKCLCSRLGVPEISTFG